MTPKVQHDTRHPAADKDDAWEDSEDELNLSDDEGRYVEGIYIPPAQKPTLSFDPTGPRLMITKIVNHFFKSYAQQQVLGPFHKCFNAIVGPNGSGKSNVIDSMLFVFGYRATKIRCKKVSVLVHKSDTFRDVHSCSVAVHFALIVDKPGDEYDIVPGSEFIVKRTANKDNSSFYELNGLRVQFKEIGVVLKKHGIDLVHNRFLILQGEVEQIAMMKCKADNENESGMLEYLEDIVGTSRYKQPLVQVFEKLEVLSDMRTEKINRLNLVEKEMESLRGPMEEAVGFLKTENSLVHNKNFLYQKHILELKGNIASDDEAFQGILAEQNEYVEKLKVLTEEKLEKESVLKEEASVYNKLNKEKEKVSQAYEKIDKRDTQLYEDMTNKNKKRKKLKETIVADKKKLEQLAKVPEENTQAIAECEERLEETIAKKAKFEEEKEGILLTISSETRDLQQKKEDMQKDLVVLKEAANKTKASYHIAETELRMFLENEGTEQKKLEALQTQYETTQKTIQQRTDQLAEIKRQIPDSEKSLKKANEDLLKVKQDEGKALSEMKTKREAVAESRSSMQASKSRGRVLDSLMKAKREGKCAGLFGRLGDLGAIDPKYDVAVSTACGPLDNIVVDTVDCAQWCIEYLKQHDIGRAVFIALEKQEYLRHSAEGTIQTPENVPRLYDLIRVQDERVKTAFYYALRDTLVATDLDQATRIAYGARRYRVVTLKGELIETSGTMSGGGRAMKGRMGQSVLNTTIDPNQLANMEEQLQAVEQFVRELRQRQTVLDNQIETLIPALRTMKIDQEKLTREIENLQKQMPNLKRQIKEQEAKALAAPKGDPRKLEQIVEQKKQKYDEASQAAGALQVQVDKLTQEINEKTSGKLRGVNKGIKTATDFITKCKAEITRLKVSGKTAERTFKTTSESIERMEKEVVEIENSLRLMHTERCKIEEEGRELLKRTSEIAAELADKEKSYEDIQKQVSDINKREKKIKSEKIDVDDKVKTMKKKVDGFKHKIQAWEAKLASLSLQDVPNDTTEQLKKYTDEELNERNFESVEKQINASEAHLKAAKPNVNAIEDYRKIQDVYVTRSKELTEVVQKRNEVRKVYDELRDNRKTEFMKGFHIIRMKLKEMYQMITLGGDADLELVDSYDPFTEGVQLNIRPPRKSWKKISNLSGGEKTLSSLALVFALHYYKPSPLYVMDEIDAALDYKNVSIVANYIKERNKNAQFIIISLRDNMFDLCDNLIGIYKTYDCTKSVTICPKLYASPPNKEQDNLNIENNQNIVNVDSQRTTNANQNPPEVVVARPEASHEVVSVRRSNKRSLEPTHSDEQVIPSKNRQSVDSVSSCSTVETGSAPRQIVVHAEIHRNVVQSHEEIQKDVSPTEEEPQIQKEVGATEEEPQIQKEVCATEEEPQSSGSSTVEQVTEPNLNVKRILRQNSMNKIIVEASDDSSVVDNEGKSTEERMDCSEIEDSLQDSPEMDVD